MIVLGGGSAGFLAAITLKRKLPGLNVTVVRSKELGIIGVGEGSTALLPNFLHGYLRILLKANGFYCQRELGPVCLNGALMNADRVFEVRPDGKPAMFADVAYHVGNASFVSYIERVAERLGVKVKEDLVRSTERRADGDVAALVGESGKRYAGEFFVDCSGFKSYLIGEVLGEPLVDYSSSLFCDRAIVGGWERRPEEPIRPYTIAQTMNAGWSWQIEHENRVDRGYVYCPAFISDADAEAEFRGVNPRLGETRLVRVVSGRRRNGWVKNVCAVGNAYGFVEPLEATALSAICRMCMTMTDQLIESGGVNYPASATAYNQRFTRTWDAIRWSLAMHYKFNTRLDTPFWRAVRSDVNVGDAAGFIDYFQQVGPCCKNTNELLYGSDVFDDEGYLIMLVGMQVPYQQQYTPSDQEWHFWRQTQHGLTQRAQRAMGVKQALQMIRSPDWDYDDSYYRPID